MLAEVRVPPAGDGDDGVSGADLGATDVELTTGCLVLLDVVDLFFGDFAERLNVPMETPMMHKRTPNKLRAVIKPDFEFRFLFIVVEDQ